MTLDPDSLKSKSREEISELLRAHGITPTHQRMEIAQVLFEKRWHPSADQILAAVNVRYAETSKATVYNTLKLFLEKALVRELIVDANKVFYDSNTSEHHHYYDIESGEITDIVATGIRVDGLPPLPAGMVAAGIDIIVRTRPAL